MIAELAALGVRLAWAPGPAESGRADEAPGAWLLAAGAAAIGRPEAVPTSDASGVKRPMISDSAKVTTATTATTLTAQCAVSLVGSVAGPAREGRAGGTAGSVFGATAAPTVGRGALARLSRCSEVSRSSNLLSPST
ncbi:hypothetical protein [Acidiferrimicrobium sp. IK]|uniref:hypothetical protein n=1 Tax=Acidiferrimicrobium sp. IK TaxID=2871700 RepID=UPI0021CB0905|nr:hypothetical protein [Acidiferrimicrobium sp. IK]